MLSISRLQVLILFCVVVIASVLLVDTFFMEETTAQLVFSNTCSVLDARCSSWRGIATFMCNTHGWSSATCAHYLGIAYSHCYYWTVNCGGG